MGGSGSAFAPCSKQARRPRHGLGEGRGIHGVSAWRGVAFILHLLGRLRRALGAAFPRHLVSLRRTRDAREAQCNVARRDACSLQAWR